MPGVGSRIQTYENVIPFPTSKQAGTITIASEPMYPFEGKGQGGSWDKAVIHIRWGDSGVTDTLTFKTYANWNTGDSHTGDSRAWIQIGEYSEATTDIVAGDTFKVIPFCPRLRIDAVFDSTGALDASHGTVVDVIFYEKNPEVRRRENYDCVTFGDTYAAFGDTKAMHIGTVDMSAGRGFGDGDTGDSGQQGFRLYTWPAGDSYDILLDADLPDADSIAAHITNQLRVAGDTLVEAYVGAGDSIGLRSVTAGDNVWFTIGDTQIGDSDASLTFGWTGDTYWGSSYVADAGTSLSTGIFGDTLDLESCSTVIVYAGAVDSSKIVDTIQVKVQHSEDMAGWRDIETGNVSIIANGTGPTLLREQYTEGDTTGLYRYVRAVVLSASGDSDAIITSGHGLHVHVIGIEE
tara:strand:+ start:912 stop:2129 length:1218 start_codon:yes stop_codon:yes gene_type:complete